MRTAAAALIAATALTAVASPALAQSAADKADVRCILVLQAAGREPKNADAAKQGTFYYLGRLHANRMMDKLEATIIAEGRALNTAPAIQAELTRCGAELTARSAELRSVFVGVQAKVGPPPGAAAAPPAKK